MESLSGKRVLVIGMGVSGLAASRLLLAQGADVTAVDGTQIPIQASKFIKGKSNQTAALVIGLLLCFPFLFMKGGEASLQSGSMIQAYTL